MRFFETNTSAKMQGSETTDNIFEGYLSTQNLISSTFIQAMRKIADDEKADKKLTPEDEFALYFIASLACLDPDSAFSKTYSENISKDAKDQKSILALTISKYSRAIVNKLSKTYLIQYQDRSISLQDLIFAENYDGFSNMLIQIKEIRARYDFFEYAKRRLFNYYMKTKDFDNAGMLLESLDSYKSFNISPDNLMLEINSEIGLYTYDLYRPVTIFDLFNFQNKQTASEFLERIMPLFDELTSHLPSIFTMC